MRYGESPFLLGIHEPPEDSELARLLGGQGWILHLAELGHDPMNLASGDYRRWADLGYGNIVRLQHGWGLGAGTIPLERYYEEYAQRAINFMVGSRGCHIWQFGNELNHANERPAGPRIMPEGYARLYRMVRERMPAGHQLVMAPIAPWYPPDPTAYLQYYWRCLELCEPDAIAWHAYSRGADRSSIQSEERMTGAPYTGLYAGFRVYRDWAAATPERFRMLPVYITETNQYASWLNRDTGWTQGACTEIGAWNESGGLPLIRALVLYRWPVVGGDMWGIKEKTALHQDIIAARRMGIRWEREVEPVPTVARFPCPNCGHVLEVRVGGGS